MGPQDWVQVNGEEVNLANFFVNKTLRPKGFIGQAQAAQGFDQGGAKIRLGRVLLKNRIMFL
jgi:hypothetical protein